MDLGVREFIVGLAILFVGWLTYEIYDIRTNHLKHIELDIREIKTILNERLPRIGD